MKTMKCKQVQSLLSAYSDGELAGQSQAAVAAHLGDCPACRSELEVMASDRRALGLVSVPEHPAFLVTRVMAEVRNRPGARREFALGRALSTAAAVLVVAASIGVGTLVGTGLAQQNSVVATSSDNMLSVATSDPVIELQQTAIGGE
jgi:predicted anti-sigma-YlaC factor YlaD